MPGSGPVAIRITRQGFTVAFKLSAGGRPVLIDAAAYLSTYITKQGNTALRCPFSSFHTTVDLIYLVGKVIGYKATSRFCLAPVE